MDLLIMAEDQQSENNSLAKRGAFCGYRLLERKAEKVYIDEWTNLLAKPVPYNQDFKYRPVVIFRIFDEWLALSTYVFVEIGDKRKLHSIPNRSNNVLLGMINLRGQLRVCIGLHNFLDIRAGQSDRQDILKNYQMILAIQKDGDFWTIPVHEVYGIYYSNPENVHNVPVTISKSTANYLQGVINWEGKNVGYLDEELLFYSLKRSLL